MNNVHFLFCVGVFYMLCRSVRYRPIYDTHLRFTLRQETDTD